MTQLLEQQQSDQQGTSSYRILHDVEGFHCQHHNLGRWWHGTHPAQNAYSIFPSLTQSSRYFGSYGHTNYDITCIVDGCMTCPKGANS